MFLNGYPYTDFHELNLDFLLRSMEELKKAFASFTASNSLIFAEPMLHDLTSTYAKNTIVLDPDGNAYISLQNVPSGVQLSNADYWLMVFNFEEYTEKANKNFTVNYLRDTTRAPQAYAVGDWIVLDDVLYKVTVAIAADELLEVGTNIVHFTIEQFLKDFTTSIVQTVNQYKNDIDASELAYRQQLAQDIANTTASLQTQLDLAISGATVDSEVINARLGADGVTYDTLGNAIRTQFTNVNNAFIPSLNLLDPENYQDGGYYNSTGTWVEAATQCTSNFIEVEPEETYYINYTATTAMVFFDANKDFVSRTPGITNGVLTIPNDNTIKYMCINFQYSYAAFDSLMVVKDVRPSWYVPFDAKDLKYFSLENKNIAVFGDSITANETRWLDMFKLRLSPKNVDNFALRGAHWRDYSNTTYPYNGNPTGTDDQPNNVLGNQVQKFINGYNNNLYPSPDIVIFFAGTNDNWNYETGTDIEDQFTDNGAYIDIEDVDRKLFAGAMRWCVEHIYTVNRAAEILIVTPIQCAEDVHVYTLQKDKADRITEVAKRMSLKVIDGFNRSGIYGRYEASGVDGTYLIDGLHPNTKGGVKLGNFMADEYCRIHLSGWYSSVASWEE